MRRLFVLAVIGLTVALGASVALAGNQEEANRIAKRLGEAFPQYDIEVAYQEGRVRLQGEIASEADREVITRFVRQIPKVRTISDTFTITGASSAQTAIPMMGSMPSLATGEFAVNSDHVRPVSALRANEPVYISQAPVQASGGELVAPPMISSEVPVNTSSDSLVGVMPGNAESMPMGVPVGGEMNGGQYNTVTRGPSDYMAPQGYAINPSQSGQPNLPNYAWPTTADYPNYSQVGYPKQYAAGAFPYIGPFYPYPQVPLGWRKVTMEWHDGYWWLDFNDGSANGPFSPLFRQPTRYR